MFPSPLGGRIQTTIGKLGCNQLFNRELFQAVGASGRWLGWISAVSWPRLITGGRVDTIGHDQRADPDGASAEFEIAGDIQCQVERRRAVIGQRSSRRTARRSSSGATGMVGFSLQDALFLM